MKQIFNVLIILFRFPIKQLIGCIYWDEKQTLQKILFWREKISLFNIKYYFYSFFWNAFDSSEPNSLQIVLDCPSFFSSLHLIAHPNNSAHCWSFYALLKLREYANCIIDSVVKFVIEICRIFCILNHLQNLFFCHNQCCRYIIIGWTIFIFQYSWVLK